MTAIVRKGANRGAHSARTAKAAQRTPLPPKGATSAPSKTDTAKVLKEEFDKKKAPSTGKATGMDKAQELVKLATDSGWEADTTEPAPDVVEARLTRGDEEITVTWVNGVITPTQMPTYLVGTRHVKLRNVSAVRKQLSADYESRPVKDVQPRAKRSRPAEEDGSLPANSPRRRVPFDVEIATEEEIFTAIRGRRIKWRNQLAGGTINEGWVAKDAKLLKLVDHPHRPTRVLTFCDTKGGFRSVALDRLLVVGK